MNDADEDSTVLSHDSENIPASQPFHPGQGQQEETERLERQVLDLEIEGMSYQQLLQNLRLDTPSRTSTQSSATSEQEAANSSQKDPTNSDITPPVSATTGSFSDLGERETVIPNRETIRPDSDDPQRRHLVSLETERIGEGLHAITCIFNVTNPEDTARPKLEKFFALVCRLVTVIDDRVLDLSYSRTQPLEYYIHQHLNHLFELAKNLREMDFSKRALLRMSIPVPDLLTQALCYTCLAISHAQDQDYDGESIAHHASMAELSLLRSFYEVLQTLQKPPLEIRVAAMPRDLLGYLVQSVVGEAVPDSFNITKPYTEYVRRLEHEVRVLEPTQATAKKLRFLRHELDAVNAQLQDQGTVVHALRDQLLIAERRTQDGLVGKEDEKQIRDDHGVVQYDVGKDPRTAVLDATIRDVWAQSDTFHTFARVTDDLLEEVRTIADIHGTYAESPPGRNSTEQ